MKTPLTLISGIISVVTKGLPLVETAKSLFTKKKSVIPVNATTLTKEQLIELVQVAEKEPDFKTKMIKLIAEAGVVWLFVFSIKKLGFTYDDIITLFGIINK